TGMDDCGKLLIGQASLRLNRFAAPVVPHAADATDELGVGKIRRASERTEYGQAEDLGPPKSFGVVEETHAPVTGNALTTVDVADRVENVDAVAAGAENDELDRSRTGHARSMSCSRIVATRSTSSHCIFANSGSVRLCLKAW